MALLWRAALVRRQDLGFTLTLTLVLNLTTIIHRAAYHPQKEAEPMSYMPVADIVSCMECALPELAYAFVHGARMRFERSCAARRYSSMCLRNHAGMGR